jgi:hypothetical protein
MPACEHSSTGNWWCDQPACRTRWLVGTTTGLPYQPAPLGTLVLDILETWCGEWMSEEQLFDHCERIRPGVNPLSVRAATIRIRCDVGDHMAADPQPGEWVDARGRLHSANGDYALRDGRWIGVDCQPDILARTSDARWLLRVARREH